MSWYIETPSHWILIVSITVAFGVATYKLHGDSNTYRGKARKGHVPGAWLVEAK